MIKYEHQVRDHLLLVDAGNSILGGWEPDYESKARLMVGAMNRMGYDALAVGPGELRLGSEELAGITDHADFPFLSANLTRGAAGPLLVQPHTSLQLDGHRLAIIGVTASEATDIQQLEKGEVGVLEPIESVRQQVAVARDGAEVIVVLSHLGLEMDRKLAREVRGIHLIVGSRLGESLEEPEQDELTGTVIVQAGRRGEWLGIIDLELDHRGRIVSYEARNRVLSEDTPEDPEFNAWLQSAQPTPTPTPKRSE